MRYNTRAAKYYRERLVATVDGKQFKEEPPGFDEGKEILNHTDKSHLKLSDINKDNTLNRKRSFDNT